MSLDTYDEEGKEEINELIQENWKLKLKIGEKDLLLLKIKELVENQENGICIIIKNLIG